MIPSKLKKALKLHRLWLLDTTNGKKLSLVGANLVGFSLRHADLRYADLTGANLSYTDLFNVDLSEANLQNATLTGANLMFAKLHNTNLTNATLPHYDIAPIKGAFIAWKRIGNVVFQMRVASATKRISVLTSRVIRVESARIIAAYTLDGNRIKDRTTFTDLIDTTKTYTVGDVVYDNTYSDDICTPYAGGIKLYITPAEAVYGEAF